LADNIDKKIVQIVQILLNKNRKLFLEKVEIIRVVMVVRVIILVITIILLIDLK
jgi:hypothetical protein